MQKGTIKNIVQDRGFGFITPDAGGKSVFFHCRDLYDMDFDETLIERRIRFEIIDSPKGPRAANVRPA